MNRGNIRAVMGFSVYKGDDVIEWPGGVGTPRAVTPKELASMPPHDNADDCIRVPLHSRRHPNLTALIDPEDAELVSQYRWGVSRSRNTIYAYFYRVGYMHRLILKNPSQSVDHINGNGLDNRRVNLRPCSVAENSANQIHYKPNKTSYYRGVSYRRDRNKWRADICVNQDRQCIGRFDSEFEAAKAYDEKARELFGKFARLNFPEKGEQAA